MSAKHYKKVICIIGQKAGLSQIEIDYAKNHPADFLRYALTNNESISIIGAKVWVKTQPFST